MKAVWLNGWSLEEGEALPLVERLYPDCQHVVINSVPGWEETLDGHADANVLIGYSLGSFLLLGRLDLAHRFKRVVFLAPFEDFKAEAGLGGKTRQAQLVYLLRWLDRDAPSAIADFRARAVLGSNREAGGVLPVEVLKWGIERLLKDVVSFEPFPKLEAYIGSEDPLLDAARIRERHADICCVEGAGHDLSDLLEKSELRL